MSAAVSGLLTLLMGGSAIAALAKVVLAVAALVIGLLYRRYLGILGADRRRPAERQAYDRLRATLAEGNLAARLYAERLTRFLDGVDRFFGDAGMADQTLLPHVFGLNTPAPLWTARAFDRCLLLALIYPVATIFLIWAVSGHFGPAEAALGLKPNFAGWQRGFTAAGAVCSIFLSMRLLRPCTPITIRAIALTPPNAVMFPWWSFLRMDEKRAYKKAVVSSALVLGASAFGVGFVLGPMIAGALFFFAIALSAAAAPPIIARGSLNGAIAVSMFVALFLAAVVGLPLIDVYPGIVGVNLALLILSGFLVAVLLPCKLAIIHRREGKFLLVFIPAMMLTCLGAANFLPPLWTWELSGPLLLFVGLLALLSAPFNWASLGLTRALLRRGLELGGWWPYALALVDACLAAVIIAAFALTIVIGVQTFVSSQRMAAAPPFCLWTRSSAASLHIRRRRNIGGSIRSCSRP